MSTNFPTSLDTLTNPTGSDQVGVVLHSSQHINANDAIEALEAKVGADSSAVTTSHDYKLSEVTGADVAVGKAASQTLTNKTLTTPTIGSFANANHNHADSAGGGTLGAAAIASGTIATARLGSGSADSTTFLRGDSTWQTVAIGSNAVTIIPYPAHPPTTGNTAQVVSTTTTMIIGQVMFFSPITVNKLSVRISSYSAAGTVKIGLWSADGSTQVLTGTTASISADGIYTVTLGSPVSVSAGQYFLGAVATGTSNFAVVTFNTSGSDDFGTVTGEPKLEGTYTVTAGTLPATVTPTSITQNQAHTPIVRFDN